MSFIALYIAKALLLPPLGLLLAAILALAGKRKSGGRVALICLILLLLLSLPAVVNRLALAWERFPPLARDAYAQVQPQALVVIGGGLLYGETEYPDGVTLHPRSLIRARYAAKLALALNLPVLASGGGSPEAPEISEAGLMAEMLENEYGVPQPWRETASRNTAENARFSYALLHELGIDRIVLVTQAYHMPRAELEFRKAGFRVVPAPTAFIGHQGPLSWADWVPSVSAWSNVFLLAHEAVGMFWYRLRY